MNLFIFFVVYNEIGLCLHDNLFIENIAESEGGAIKWEGVQPKIENNTFINNTAIYGDNVAAFPFRLHMSYSPYTETICNKTSNECYFSFANIASGSVLNFSLEFLVKDIYNQTCASINNQ